MRIRLWGGAKTVAAPPRQVNVGVPVGKWGRVGMTSVVANAGRARVTGAIKKLNLGFPLRGESQAKLVGQGSRETP